MSNHFLFHYPRKESGAVLITGLIFLVVLTMIVLSVLRSGTLEERMAANSRNRQAALQAAEAVLRDAEELFSKPPFDPYDHTSFSGTCFNGYCWQPDANSTWQRINWNSSSLTRSFAYSVSNISGLSTQPRYIVEIVRRPGKSGSFVGSLCDVNGTAKITARGVGNDSSTVFVQSTVEFKSSGCSDSP